MFFEVMRMEIKASCTFNLDAFRALRRSGLTKGRIIFYWIASAIILVDIVLLTVISSFPFWLAGLFLLWVVYVLYLYSWSAKLAYNRNKISKDCVVNYTFREDSYHSCVQTSTLSEDADIAYSGLYRVREGQRYIYLISPQHTAQIVDKTTMEPGHAAIVSGRMKNALGKNYKFTSTQ